MCSCIITYIYVHLTPYVRFTPTNLWMEVYFQLEVEPLNEGPTSSWRSNLSMEVPPPNGDPSSACRSHWNHCNSVPKHLLECVCATVHVCMSTWLPILPQTPMHKYMETWVLLYGTVSVCQSSPLCSHTLFRMCTCINIWIYFQLTAHVCSTPYA